MEFSLDGSQMAVMGNSSYSIWGTPDETLKAGFEVVKQFQEALSTGDYEQAASLFSTTESELDYLKEFGLTRTTWLAVLSNSAAPKQSSVIL